MSWPTRRPRGNRIPRAIAPVHDRMPVILPPDRADLWLEEPAEELLAPVEDDYLVGTPVSTRVNRVENDDPSLLDPGHDHGPRQKSVFD